MNLIKAWHLDTDMSVILTSESCPLPNFINCFYAKLIMWVPLLLLRSLLKISKVIYGTSGLGIKMVSNILSWYLTLPIYLI